jgi:hypothetical protein
MCRKRLELSKSNTTHRLIADLYGILLTSLGLHAELNRLFTLSNKAGSNQNQTPVSHTDTPLPWHDMGNNTSYETSTFTCKERSNASKPDSP